MNMSYCRFENTERDLRDCFRHLREPTIGMDNIERTARLRMIAMVTKMAEEIGNMTADEIENGDPDFDPDDMIDGLVG